MDRNEERLIREAIAHYRMMRKFHERFPNDDEITLYYIDSIDEDVLNNLEFFEKLALKIDLESLLKTKYTYNEAVGIAYMRCLYWLSLDETGIKLYATWAEMHRVATVLFPDNLEIADNYVASLTALPASLVLEGVRKPAPLSDVKSAIRKCKEFLIPKYENNAMLMGYFTDALLAIMYYMTDNSGVKRH